MTAFIIVIYGLILIIFCLIVFSFMQIRLAGIKVKDFWTFIKANQSLDALYRFSKRYERMNNQEQIIFLKEAERVFQAFDKVPDVLWEEEYSKYADVLNAYQSIRMLRWQANS